MGRMRYIKPAFAWPFTGFFKSAFVQKYPLEFRCRPVSY